MQQLPELVVFDMIGTTVQSTDRVPAAFASAFEEQSIILTAADVDSIRGKSKREAIYELLAKSGTAGIADQLSDRVYESFRQHLLNSYRDAAVAAVDGAEAAFAWCRENHVKIALTTGFDREVAELLVTRLGWYALIDTLICNDDVKSGRPAPDLILCAMRRLDCLDSARVASVGDTVSDLEAGDNAATGWNIGVLSGAHARQQLESAPHTAILDSVADLPGAF